ncbi:aspartate/tyrosine/aromatic aminotransferase [Corynebacterium pseudopelargi]|uniref:DinB superfamily protein n=1 Tax=Corynebacterium pseudopelargi TaxID=2080757 RepID=A0A3G6IW54_9CORY|nr:aspartate/tyrosine/aromatic aminotransferase [Corynebacterium pseudopelargi]AZA08194.1 hypothetical protein CPPEL_00215 [Corynebacterium pseudopelargi]
MSFHDLLIDLSERPLRVLRSIEQANISLECANAHLGGHPNSIVWLLWHTGRELDIQLAELSGSEQIWLEQDFAARTGLGAEMGYGHSRQEALRVQVSTQEQFDALLHYVELALRATRNYTAAFSEQEAARILEADVTYGIRLISIIDDAIQHLAQIQYILGAQTAGPQNRCTTAS